MCPSRAIMKKKAFCMEYQEKILLLVAVLLVALAIYLIKIAPVATPAANVSTVAAEDLLLKGLSFGIGQANYVYAYREVSDGYRTNYVLTKNGNDSLVVVQNPLSTKEIYFLSNDTILCTNYGGGEACASVQSEKGLANYLESLRVKFFDDATIQANKDDLSYLIYHGYARLDPALGSGSVNSHPCTEITYVLDFGNMSVTEAARFGVSATTPKAFNWSVCVDNATGHLWEKSFNYTYADMLHTFTVDMVSYNSVPPTITAPENLSGDAITQLLAEKDQQVQMANCYTTKQGDALDECLATFALGNKRKDLCEFAGGRRDRCLVSLVPVTKDVSICPTIVSQSYKDDCYIELAGAYKNSSWCGNVQNVSKTGFCMNVSVPAAPEPPVVPQQNGSAANATAGQNGSMAQNSSVDINKFLNFVDQANSTNVTATANHS
jgi:hypothetical protein